MGIAERKEREKLRRKEHIVDAAEEVIFSKGLENTTMDEIAERAELSKGTLYLYFKNKNELYMAICERGSNILNSRFGKVFSEEMEGIDLIRKLGETYLSFVRNNPDYFNAFMFYETLEDVEELKQSDMAHTCEKNIREAMTYTLRALQIGMQDGTIDDSYDPRELATLIWGSTRGMIQMSHMKRKGHHYKIIDEMDINDDSMFESFLDFVGRGMSPKIN